ncbi:hypothetical protein HG535_0C00470 [Zygotorulaspora mrakii]|uniref:Meiotic sister chromatid recombination protein 1 n=1 Tax=Zygotorulaspora mrakii TaxID=42260 RepID=A0A7H9AZ57_ZYGMR|nr:uncharacterized protein HG535_0C00470 [Zygotorulaspora mrakii]QLG71698.1 hypothetical protein HG535_0C00470 [Zygotorulaspora mrakii]
MRQNILLSLLLAAAGAVTVVADQSNFNFEGWTQKDLQQYVEDHKKYLDKLGSKSVEDLKEELADKWAPTAQPKPWWQIWPSDDTHAWLKRDSKKPVSDWLFDTWSESDLKKFLKQHKIKYDAKASKDSLIKVAKDSFQNVSDKLECSGFYPSSEYFSDWSVDDLKEWLNDYQIPYDKAVDTKDELVDQVRENLYHASQLASEKRLEVLDSLDFVGRQLVDKSGEVKDDVLNSFSTKQLADWLENHKIAVDKKVAENRDELLKLAKNNARLLKDDMAWYAEKMSEKASPFLTKPPEYVESLWDKTAGKIGGLFAHYKHKSNEAINDTFLVDLNNWSRDRMKRYLDVRGIKYHLLATNGQLRQMVQDSRNSPLKNVRKHYEKLTENINYDDMKNWAQDKADQIQDSNAYESVSDKISSLNQDTQKWAQDISEKWSDSLTSWSVDDLRTYLKSFGVDTSTSTKDDLVEAAKLKTQMFFGSFHEPWYARWMHKARFYVTHPLSIF